MAYQSCGFKLRGPETGPMVLSELWVQVEGTLWSHGPIRAVGFKLRGPETGPMVLSELWVQVEGTLWSHGPIRAVGSS